MKIVIIILGLIIGQMQDAFANQVVRYHVSEKYPDAKQSFYIDLLRLALEETKLEYGPYFMQPVPVEMSQGRTSIMVELDHGIDVTWRMTTTDLEERMLPIYIPLLKGLMGYRIFIINADDQHKFPKDLTKAELAKLSAGQGYDWPDIDILHHNKMKLTTGADHRLLLMLEKKRFDYFPRALHEPWLEIKDNDHFIVEKNLMLQYPAPLYFFVNKKNTELRDRILLGLNKAIDNGKFDQVFYQHSVTRTIFSLANLTQRKVFYFENPSLSPTTKNIMTDKRLWLDINNTKTEVLNKPE